MRKWPVLLVLALASGQPLWADPPQIDWLFPPGGQAGQDVVVTVAGKLPDAAVQGWTASSELKIAAQSEKQQFTIAIAENARPGVHWIRLFSDQGASALRPFLVETVPQRNEDQLTSDPLELTPALVVHGRLQKNNEVDVVPLRLAAGQTLVASVMAHRVLKSPMDVVMQLYDLERDVVIDQADDAPGLDPLLVHTAARDGTYAIRLFAFPETPTSRIGFAGGDNFIYRLTLSLSGMMDHTVPLSVSRWRTDKVEAGGWSLPGGMAVESMLDPASGNATFFQRGIPGWSDVQLVNRPSIVELSDATEETPLRIDAPCYVTGRLDNGGHSDEDSEDVYEVVLAHDIKWRLAVAARQLGFPTDAVLSVRDAAGKQLARVDDAGGGRDCALDFTAPADGTYQIVVRDLYGQSGERHWYQLNVEQVEPSFRAVVERDVWAGNAGEPVEIPVTIERQHGFADRVFLHMVGLPDGFHSVPVVSESEGDTAKSVKMMVKAENAAQVPIRILATTRTGSEHEWITAPRNDGGRTSDLWLSVLSAPATENDSDENQSDAK